MLFAGKHSISSLASLKSLTELKSLQSPSSEQNIHVVCTQILKRNLCHDSKKIMLFPLGETELNSILTYIN